MHRTKIKVIPSTAVYVKYQDLRTGTGAETKLKTTPGRKIIVSLKVNSIRGLNKNEEQNVRSNNATRSDVQGDQTADKNLTARRGVLGRGTHLGPRLYPVCNVRNGLMVQGMERGDVFRRHKI